MHNLVAYQNTTISAHSKNCLLEYLLASTIRPVMKDVTEKVSSGSYNSDSRVSLHCDQRG